MREKYKDFFEHIERELLEKWTQVWREQGFDVSKVRVSVSPRITVSLAEDNAESKEEHEI